MDLVKELVGVALETADEGTVGKACAACAKILVAEGLTNADRTAVLWLLAKWLVEETPDRTLGWQVFHSGLQAMEAGNDLIQRTTTTRSAPDTDS